MAAALAPADSDARTFVCDGVAAYLKQFGQIDAASIVAQGLREQPTVTLGPHGRELRSPGADFLFGLSLLGALEYLQTPDAERLTFEFFDCDNMFIRQALGLLAVMRWPDRFLTINQQHIEERTKLLAALTVFHPRLLSKAQAMAQSGELEKFRSSMLSDGVSAIFSLPGNAGLVF